MFKNAPTEGAIACLISKLTSIEFEKFIFFNMNKRRKLSTPPEVFSPVKVEVKEENVYGNEYLQAKGRLQGVLKQLTEQSETESGSSDESNQGYTSKK